MALLRGWLCLRLEGILVIITTAAAAIITITKVKIWVTPSQQLWGGALYKI